MDGKKEKQIKSEVFRSTLGTKESSLCDFSVLVGSLGKLVDTQFLPRHPFHARFRRNSAIISGHLQAQH